MRERSWDEPSRFNATSLMADAALLAQQDIDEKGRADKRGDDADRNLDGREDGARDRV